jgi:hypothetical protein
MKKLLKWATLLLGIAGGLAVCGYFLENRTGARALASAKARVAAAGETLDFRSLFPPLPPAGQNLGAIPCMADFTRRGGKNSDCEALIWNERSTARHKIRFQKPKLEGASMDLPAWAGFMAEHGHLPIAETATAAEFLAALDARHPLLKQLADSAPLCSSCIFLPRAQETAVELDLRAYPMAHIYDTQRIVKALQLRAAVAALAKQSQEALHSLEAMILLAEGALAERLTIGLLVGQSSLGNSLSSAATLVTTQALNPQHRAALAERLKSVDLWQRALDSARGELAIMVSTIQLRAQQSQASWPPRGYTDHNVANLLDSLLPIIEVLDRRDEPGLESAIDHSVANFKAHQQVWHVHHQQLSDIRSLVLALKLLFPTALSQKQVVADLNTP